MYAPPLFRPRPAFSPFVSGPVLRLIPVHWSRLNTGQELQKPWEPFTPCSVPRELPYASLGGRMRVGVRMGVRMGDLFVRRCVMMFFNRMRGYSLPSHLSAGLFGVFYAAIAAV